MARSRNLGGAAGFTGCDVGADDDEDDDDDLAEPAERSEVDLALLWDLSRLLSKVIRLASCGRSHVYGLRFDGELVDGERDSALEEGFDRCLAMRLKMLRPRFGGTSTSSSDSSLPFGLIASSFRSWRLPEMPSIWLLRPKGAPKLLNWFSLCRSLC